MATLLERIESLRETLPNWDSYGADAPNPETLHVGGVFLQTFVDTFRLPDPYITPTRIGGLLAFWTIGPHEIEVEFETKGKETLVSYVYENEQTGEKASGEFILRRAGTSRAFALDAIAQALSPPPAVAV